MFNSVILTNSTDKFFLSSFAVCTEIFLNEHFILAIHPMRLNTASWKLRLSMYVA